MHPQPRVGHQQQGEVAGLDARVVDFGVHQAVCVGPAAAAGAACRVPLGGEGGGAGGGELRHRVAHQVRLARAHLLQPRARQGGRQGRRVGQHGPVTARPEPVVALLCQPHHLVRGGHVGRGGGGPAHVGQPVHHGGQLVAVQLRDALRRARVLAERAQPQRGGPPPPCARGACGCGGGHERGQRVVRQPRHVLACGRDQRRAAPVAAAARGSGRAAVVGGGRRHGGAAYELRLRLAQPRAVHDARGGQQRGSAHHARQLVGPQLTRRAQLARAPRQHVHQPRHLTRHGGALQQPP
mmetsp:Transcript_9791/g.24406  ORF Transcript_9791/g.24406 Transcript_9791/m.24406 type:complete len:296 (+) Transcript_9791:1396-2283(+)